MLVQRSGRLLDRWLGKEELTRRVFQRVFVRLYNFSVEFGGNWFVSFLSFFLAFFFLISIDKNA